MDQIANARPNDLAVIRYHVNWPSPTDPYYQFNISENMARNNYYSNIYTPYIYFDGNIVGGSYSSWASQINSESQVASPLDIQLSGSLNYNTRLGTIDVMIIATSAISYTSLKMRLAITESNIRWQAPNGTLNHHQTFRDMVPSTSGQAFTIAQGDTAIFHEPINLRSPMVLSNCSIVVFVQSDNGSRRILQGAKIAVPSLQRVYELSPFSLVAPRNDSTLSTCYPICTWRRSSDPDSGYAINYEVQISLDPEFTNPIVSDPPLSDSTWTCPYCLMNDTLFYWRVRAFNGHAPDKYSTQTYQFRIHEVSCQYVAGDVNGNGVANGLDVTYMVNYLRGGVAPPDTCECGTNPNFLVSSDANGSCSVNGLDVTYMVNFYRGGGAPISFCTDCPSGGRSSLLSTKREISHQPVKPKIE